MAGYFLLALTIIALIISVKITSKEHQEHGKLTKSGIKKLVFLLAVVFFTVVLVVYFSPESWA